MIVVEGVSLGVRDGVRDRVEVSEGVGEKVGEGEVWAKATRANDERKDKVTMVENIRFILTNEDGPDGGARSSNGNKFDQDALMGWKIRLAAYTPYLSCLPV